ncbi:MAG: CsbD family protein [Erysipelotrichaceae bacterium]
MNDKVKGKINQTKGAVKTKIGNLTDNNKLKIEGLKDTVIGKSQEISGDIKQSVKETKRKLKK